MSARYFFTDSEHKILGPRKLSEIRAFLDAGHIDHSSEVCEENDQEWIPIDEVLSKLPKATEVPLNTTPEEARTPPMLPMVDPESAPIADLLDELKNRDLEVNFNDGRPPVTMMIENADAHLIELTTSDGSHTYFMPVQRLFCIHRNAVQAKISLEFR